MKYKLLFKKESYIEYSVEAETKEKAITKAEEGDYIEIVDDEYFLPSSEWECVECEVVQDE